MLLTLTLTELIRLRQVMVAKDARKDDGMGADGTDRQNS